MQPHRWGRLSHRKAKRFVSCRLGVQHLAVLTVGVRDRPARIVTAEPVKPTSPSLGADPLDFENKMFPSSSYARMTDPRSTAPLIMGVLSRDSERFKNDIIGPDFVEQC